MKPRIGHKGGKGPCNSWTRFAKNSPEEMTHCCPMEVSSPSANRLPDRQPRAHSFPGSCTEILSLTLREAMRKDGQGNPEGASGGPEEGTMVAQHILAQPGSLSTHIPLKPLGA